MGWTGDAQAFVKTASYNFDVDRFFTKWLADMAADQRPDGSIGHVVPTFMWEAAALPGMTPLPSALADISDLRG